jgi:hypothetical protein
VNVPRRARVSLNGRPGWLTVFPNGVAFVMHDDVGEYVPGFPAVYYPFSEIEMEKVGGRVVEWIDADNGE